MKKFISESYEDTLRIAGEFAKTLKAGDIVTLDGDLGAGKTAFSQGVAKALDVTDYVSSPTFTIVNCYEGGSLPVYHFDVYRIDEPDDMYDIGFDEYVGTDGVCLIEWSEKILKILPSPRYEVIISKDNDKHDDYRVITIEEK